MTQEGGTRLEFSVTGIASVGANNAERIAETEVGAVGWTGRCRLVGCPELARDHGDASDPHLMVSATRGLARVQTTPRITPGGGDAAQTLTV